MRRNTELELRTQREERRVLWSISFRLFYWEVREASLKGILCLFICSSFCYVDLDFFPKGFRSFIKLKKKKRHVCSKTQKVKMKQQDPCPPHTKVSFHPPSLLVQHRGAACVHYASPQHCFLGFSKYVMLCVEYIFVKKGEGKLKKKKKRAKGNKPK